jgi:hypothetical protein
MCFLHFSSLSTEFVLRCPRNIAKWLQLLQISKYEIIQISLLHVTDF